MQQQEQAQNPDPIRADGGMTTRLDRSDIDRPARLGINESAAADSASREAVTLTAHHDAQEQQRQPKSLQDSDADAAVAATAAAGPDPSTSTGSHGPVIGQERHNHVSPTSNAHLNNSASPSAAAVIDTTAAESYEEQHVHSVYESIASHFSSTRYKPWPFVATFLASLLPGSVGLDVGCGNGKYLDVNPDVFIFGSDRSANLARLARDLKVNGGGEGGKRNASADVVGVADGLSLPFGGRMRVDFAICIAVIHHLSTRERRVEGVRALLDCVKPRTGKVLVYVWALEQGSSRRGWDEGTADQDQLVPWVMRSNKPKKLKKEEASKKEGGGNVADSPGDGDAGVKDATYQRYYHLYRKGELEEDVQAAGGEILGNGYEKDNWWVIASPKEHNSSIGAPR
ncbi:S-adenosyl-L-methionine-dependent methyltransferase [Hypoxylon sp. FL1857]|nr:S-adenosyl-L-methionine-dependent methyltransferase [Hypoxylon sp. FL1857]